MGNKWYINFRATCIIIQHLSRRQHCPKAYTAVTNPFCLRCLRTSQIRYTLLVYFIFQDLPASIRRVADFFGKQLNEEQMHRLCDHLSIENFKNNTSVNYEHMREIGGLAKGEKFIRKGMQIL